MGLTRRGSTLKGSLRSPRLIRLANGSHEVRYVRLAASLAALLPAFPLALPPQSLAGPPAPATSPFAQRPLVAPCAVTPDAKLVSPMPGEHARFRAINKAGFGTFGFMIFLGAAPLYITFERDT